MSEVGRLANDVIGVCMEANARILHKGAIEYDGVNRFTKESMEDELAGLEEELLDCINWAAMCILKLRARRDESGIDPADLGT